MRNTRASTMTSLPQSHSTTLNGLLSFPPNPPNPKQNLIPKHQVFQHRITVSRRDLALLPFLALVPSLSPVAPASAFSIGISGPKDWLKEQKKKASKFVLAPIDASRESLRSAYVLLTARDSEYSAKDLEEVQELLRSAARDCVPQDRSSFVSFQASTGVEVCTFRLIVKNASSLLDNKDPVKLEAEATLNDLIRSFTSLNGLASETDIQLASSRRCIIDTLVKVSSVAEASKCYAEIVLEGRAFGTPGQKVAVALMDTISFLDKFEQGIKECLEV